MSEYTAIVRWQRGDQEFLDKRYSRRHVLRFDGGAEVVGSSSPHSVPVPYSDPEAVDPEEMLVAALASCHMLWFLAVASRNGFRVDSYADNASGLMEKDSRGKHSMTVVTLRPKVEFSGEKVPTIEEIEAMHHEAHEECYIANSVKTEVRCEPVHDQIRNA